MQSGYAEILMRAVAEMGRAETAGWAKGSSRLAAMADAPPAPPAHGWLHAPSPARACYSGDDTPAGWPTRAGCMIAAGSPEHCPSAPALHFAGHDRAMGGQLIDLAAERARRTAVLAPSAQATPTPAKLRNPCPEKGA